MLVMSRRGCRRDFDNVVVGCVREVLRKHEMCVLGWSKMYIFW